MFADDKNAWTNYQACKGLIMLFYSCFLSISSYIKIMDLNFWIVSYLSQTRICRLQAISWPPGSILHM